MYWKYREGMLRDLNLCSLVHCIMCLFLNVTIDGSDVCVFMLCVLYILSI